MRSTLGRRRRVEGGVPEEVFSRGSVLTAGLEAVQGHGSGVVGELVWHYRGTVTGGDLKHELVLVGDMVSVPRRLGGGHLYDTAAHAPDIAGSAVVVSPQHLRGHESNRPQQLTLELACYGRLGGEASGCTEVPDTKPVSSAVYQQVSTFQVSVQYHIIVQIVQPMEHLLDVAQNDVLAKRSVPLQHGRH